MPFPSRAPPNPKDAEAKFWGWEAAELGVPAAAAVGRLVFWEPSHLPPFWIFPFHILPNGSDPGSPSLGMSHLAGSLWGLPEEFRLMGPPPEPRMGNQQTPGSSGGQKGRFYFCTLTRLREAEFSAVVLSPRSRTRAKVRRSGECITHTSGQLGSEQGGSGLKVRTDAHPRLVLGCGSLVPRRWQVSGSSQGRGNK